MGPSHIIGVGKMDQRRQSRRVGDRNPQIMCRGVVGVVKYYYILSCTGSRLCSKVVTFEEKWNHLPRGRPSCPSFAWKIEIFFLNCLKKSTFVRNLPAMEKSIFLPCSTTP